MGFLPLVAQEIGRDACENNAAAYQTFERSRPEGHDDHEDAAQDETSRDEQRKLQKESDVMEIHLTWEHLLNASGHVCKSATSSLIQEATAASASAPSQFM